MEYKWFFDESGVLTECEPRVDGDTKLEYAPETNEVFYRAKLNGTLSFRLEFDDILAKGFGHTHVVVLQRYNENQFVEVWRGKFTLTDCTINYETHTIEVQPATIDRYTDILNALETDYNLIKLAPKMQPVNILIRPLLQLYAIGDTKISNYIGNNYWESTCQSVGRNDIDQYKFGYQKQFISATIKYTDTVNPDYPYRAGKTITYTGELIYGGLPQESTRVYGTYWDGAAYQTDILRVRIAQMTTTTEFQFYQNPDESGTQQTPLFTAEFSAYGMGTPPTAITIGIPAFVDDALAQWDMICARILVRTDLNSIDIHGQTITIDDIPANDMAGINMNYNKTLYADLLEVYFSADMQDEPTEWGRSYTDKYFVRPQDLGLTRWMPVGQSLWKYISVWWRVDAQSVLTIINDELTATQQIKDCYDLRDTILRLLEKAGANVANLYSGVWGTNNYVGANFLPIITAKSNVISSYYNSPAQNAPISLAKIFIMLKQAYKLYWHIDENNDIHIEHISYYQNGYSYTEFPQQLVDLENELHTRTKHTKAYGQNVVKFDKAVMPALLSFGWADMQTRPFDGYDIICLDSYVDKSAKEETQIGNFDTDVDFVLSSPNDVSKDGFFLFALPLVEGAFSNTLIIERFPITDENGATFYIELQNADAAFCKIHKTFWRYDMPCENLQINNVPDTALTTGRFKTQTLDFADVSMADVIDNVDNCINLIKTQQGNGGIAKLAINLNSLATTADLVFTLFGRKYYLKGAALNGTLTITLNGEQITINVENNRFVYGYTEPINELKFANTDVVSVDFADCDTMAELTSADDMFKNCAELVAVDFANKTFGAVTTANDMFAGCVNLVDLICPATESWKPDIDFSDCPNLTLQSLNDLIVKFLYQYDSGVHTITPNSTMWNALAPEEQTDIMAKATAKGWQIGIPAQYAIVGTSNANTVYATINGNPVEIPVSAGAFRYEYNNPITAISFENDADVTLIDFTESDLLAGVTSLNNAFKGCASLVAVDFHDCDLSNVATAVDCFSGCVALTTFDADSGVWKPDVDFSDCALLDYYDMQTIVGILYTYATGTHTITFNSTTWDALSVAQQQTIFDAAQLKYWTTNAVMVIYVIRGTSSNVNGTETFTIQFINDGAQTPSTAETITCAVDAQGDWEYQYFGKKIYSLAAFARNNSTLLSIDMTDADECEQCVSTNIMFASCANLSAINLSVQKFTNATNIGMMFYDVPKIQTLSLPNATFANATDAESFCQQSPSAVLATISMPNATFASLTTAKAMFYNCQKVTAISMPNATFASLQNAFNMFRALKQLTSLSLPQTFANLINAEAMFYDCDHLQNLDLSSATFASLTTAKTMFFGMKALTAIDLSSATFANVTDGYGMFNQYGNHPLQTLSLPNATFANVTNAFALFLADGLRTLNIPNATFASVTNTSYMLSDLKNLTTINVPQGTFPKTFGFTRSNSGIALTYQSMVNVANWCKDLTGGTAQTVTFNATAWNGLSAAEQSTIDGILSGKNWTRAIA